MVKTHKNALEIIKSPITLALNYFKVLVLSLLRKSVKNFWIQIKHVFAHKLAQVSICINWRMITDVNSGTLHFCSPNDAKSRNVENGQKCQKLSLAKLAPIVPQKCYAPKSASTIIPQLIHEVTCTKLSVKTCFDWFWQFLTISFTKLSTITLKWFSA